MGLKPRTCTTRAFIIGAKHQHWVCFILRSASIFILLSMGSLVFVYYVPRSVRLNRASPLKLPLYEITNLLIVNEWYF